MSSQMMMPVMRIMRASDDGLTIEQAEALGNLPPWDYYYYRQRIMDEATGPLQEVAAYFSPEYTISATVEVVADLFGLLAVKVDTDTLEYPAVWHPDVEIYSIYEKTENTPRLLGHLFLDLYYREKKPSSRTFSKFYVRLRHRVCI